MSDIRLPKHQDAVKDNEFYFDDIADRYIIEKWELNDLIRFFQRKGHPKTTVNRFVTAVEIRLEERGIILPNGNPKVSFMRNVTKQKDALPSDVGRLPTDDKGNVIKEPEQDDYKPPKKQKSPNTTRTNI